METCGSICVSEDYKEFSLHCLYCPTEIKISNWRDFVWHAQEDHATTFVIESELEQPNNNAEKTIKTIKDEIKEEFEIDCLDEELIPIYNDNIENEKPKETTDLNEEKRDENPQTLIEQFDDFTPNDSLGEIKSEIEETNLQLQTASNATSDDDNEAYSLEPLYKFNPSFNRRNLRTLKFIKLFEEYPCLWNPQNDDYDNDTARNSAYMALSGKIHQELNIILNDSALKSAIRKLNSMYFKETRLMQDPSKYKEHPTRMRHYNACSFLKVAEEEEERVKQGPIKLEFTHLNKLTTDFIDLYASLPLLYDTKHDDYTNMISRKQAYETIAYEISISHDEATEDDVYQGVQYLRNWYNKMALMIKNLETKDISRAELLYIEKCNFLPLGKVRERFPCDMCTSKFYSEQAWQSHMFKVHNIGELPYVCPFCKRRFDNRTDMHIHKTRAHLVKTHLCRFCQKGHATIHDLALHERTHTGEKPFVCDQCGKAYRSKFQLKYHIKAIHTKNRDQKCDICPKAFYRKRELTDHMKMHLNVRDKICEICSKGFTNCHSLIRHRKTHTNREITAAKRMGRPKRHRTIEENISIDDT